MKRARPTDEPVVRELAVIKAELGAAKRDVEKAEAVRRVLDREYDAHPTIVAGREQANTRVTRRQLGAFLVPLLMERDNAVHGRLTYLITSGGVEFAGSDPVNICEIDMKWSLTGSASYEIMEEDDELYDIDPATDGFTEPAHFRKEEDLWREALRVNDGDVRRALAGFLVARKRAEDRGQQASESSSDSE